MEKTKTIVLITDTPTPYRIPLFNELARRLESNQYSLRVIFGVKSTERRRWKIDWNSISFEYEFLDTTELKQVNAPCTYKKLLSAVRQNSPHKIIVIGFTMATSKLFLQSLVLKTPYIIWTGSVAKDTINAKKLRTIQRKILASRSKGFIAYSSKTKEFLNQNLGIPLNKIFVAINTVDTEYFSKQTENFRKKNNPGKDKLSYFTFVGYLVRRKKVTAILEAIIELAKLRTDFRLDLIGDGPEKKNLEEFVTNKGIKEFVQFHGYKQKEDLPLYFSRSNCFLYQTNFDIWGLVLNEAMSAKLPCIASTNAGSTFDLIKNGDTGFALDFNNTHDVVQKMNWILENPEKANRIGENAFQFITNHASISNSVEGFLQAIEKL